MCACVCIYMCYMYTYHHLEVPLFPLFLLERQEDNVIGVVPPLQVDIPPSPFPANFVSFHLLFFILYYLHFYTMYLGIHEVQIDQITVSKALDVSSKTNKQTGASRA